MQKLAMSEGKANKLYWLGRYAERAYLSLHLLRRYFDLFLDGDNIDFVNYAKNLGPTVKSSMSFQEFAQLYIFDRNNQSSIVRTVFAANDNAVLLREVIKSESLSYIQLSVCHLEKLEQSKDKIIVNDLQKVTDCLLAFFGSLEERVHNNTAIAYIRYGRFIESLDLHLRFNYDFMIIRPILDCLIRWTSIDKSVIDKEVLSEFDNLLCQEQYDPKNSAYMSKLLSTVNKIVTL